MSTAAMRTSGIAAQTTDGRTLLLRPTALGSGAEKTAFLTTDGREVVAFFFGTLRDRAARVERLQRIVCRRVREAEDDGALCLRPQCLRVGAFGGACFEPAHVAVVAFGEEGLQPLACPRADARGGEADRVGDAIAP